MTTEVPYCSVCGCIFDPYDDDMCEPCYTLRNTIQDTAHHNTNDAIILIRELVERVRADEDEKVEATFDYPI